MSLNLASWVKNRLQLVPEIRKILKGLLQIVAGSTGPGNDCSILICNKNMLAIMAPHLKGASSSI